MFAEVNIEYGYHDNSLLAPANAVLTMDNKNIVYKVVDGKAIKVEVATGFRQDGVVEIVSGLEDGAELITAGHNNLKDQADVNVINRG
jgi:multidrug efflux pump subunit AcrA (membrane-fusion protein)